MQMSTSSMFDFDKIPATTGCAAIARLPETEVKNKNGLKPSL